MNPNTARTPADEAADPRAFSARKYLLIITIIAVCSLTFSALAPSEPRVPARDAATPASKPPAASVSAAAKGIEPARSSADKPFDYFPAQFPTPAGEIGEQPPTF